MTNRSGVQVILVPVTDEGTGNCKRRNNDNYLYVSGSRQEKILMIGNVEENHIMMMRFPWMA